jgi:hypothetical protein
MEWPLFLFIVGTLVGAFITNVYRDAKRDAAWRPEHMPDADLDAIVFQDEERYQD